MRESIFVLLFLALTACSDPPTAPNPDGYFVGMLRGDTITLNTSTGSVSWRGMGGARVYPSYPSYWRFRVTDQKVYHVAYEYETFADRLDGTVKVDSGAVQFEKERLVMWRQ